MKWILAMLLLLTVSCTSKKDTDGEQDTFSVGKYVYRDDVNVIHVDENCPNLLFGNDDHGHKIYGKHLIDTLEFTIDKPQYFRVCSICVSDEAYSQLLNISNRNQSVDTVVTVYEDYSDFPE